MRTTVMPEALRPALARCVKIASKASVQTVHSFVELTAAANTLRLHAQDAHVGLATVAPVVEVHDAGTALVECDRLAAVLGVRPDGVPLQLWLEGSFLHIKQGEFRAKLPQLRSVSMLPLDSDVHFDLDISMSTEMLHGLHRCRYTVGDEQSMFVGLLLDFTEPGTLRMAAFTRALLQVAHFDVPADLPTYRIVLAPRCVPVFDLLASGEPFRFAVAAREAKAYVFSASFTACIAILEDRYPVKYQSVLGLYRWREGVYPIPLMSSSGDVASERARSQLIFSRQDVLAALESAAVVLGRDDITIEMKIGQRLNDGRIVVEFIGANSSSKSRASEKVLAEGDVEAAMSFGLNYASVRDVLRHFDADAFVLHVGRKEDAIVFNERGREHIVALATLMRL